MKRYFDKYREAILCLVFLLPALIVEHFLEFRGIQYISIGLYTVSYLTVGAGVWRSAYRSLRKGTVFSEFMLMGIATAGAFVIGEYTEAVAVMLFYTLGEYAQSAAVSRARHSIEKLVNEQPDLARVERNGEVIETDPEQVGIGEIIVVRPGEKVPLDGELITEKAYLNTSALTGESRPLSRRTGEEIWAGSVNQQELIRIKVTKTYNDSRLSNILELVQEAAERKAPTERFITRFARWYTPAVVWIAALVVIIPWFFADPYVFSDWFYKALIVLVVSCPCGLVISVPLGYFGGIGAASQNGILFKGADYLDRLRHIKTLFMDKTGTLTEGSFSLREVVVHNGMEETEALTLAASVEQHSAHPVARVIHEAAGDQSLFVPDEQKEVSGLGIRGKVNGIEILLGNEKLLKDHQVEVHDTNRDSPATKVHLSVNGVHEASFLIEDRLRDDSRAAIGQLRRRGVKNLIMLSGDNRRVAEQLGAELGLDEYYGELMPDDKYNKVSDALGKNGAVGFVGDGVNDAPVITLSDVGIAMGGAGSDATVDTADVVIQTDQVSKVPLAMEISEYTNRIVWQNIFFALGIKLLVILMAAAGMASMWEAIFADVGVALLAIVNAIRIQHKYSKGNFLKQFFAYRDEEGRPATGASECCSTCC